MPASIVRMDKQTPMLSWRGSMLRIVNLAKEFSIPGAVEDPTQAILVVVRPAGQDPLAVVELVNLLHDVGFPEGVVNVVAEHLAALPMRAAVAARRTCRGRAAHPRRRRRSSTSDRRRGAAGSPPRGR